MKKYIAAAAACAALLPLAIPAARAQSGAPASSPSASTAINYWALLNPYYTYQDLMIAKTRDFSDTTIAKLVKISEESDTPFATLSDALYDGNTWVMLCNEYNVSLASLEHVRKQKDEVANYLSAYQTSGQYAFPNGGFTIRK